MARSAGAGEHLRLEDATHIFQPLARRALTDPDTLFCRIVGHGQTRDISVQEIMRLAAGYGDALVRHGAGPETVVTIVLEHCLDVYAAFIGATLIGSTPAILPPQTRKQDPAVHRAAMAALIERIGPVAAVVSDRTESEIPPTLPRVLTFEVEPLATWSNPRGSGADVALLQHSSGTTALKKGVMLSHRQVLSQIRSYVSALGISSRSSVVSWLPLYHDMGLMTGFVMPAVVGCPLISLDALEWVLRPTLLLEALETANDAFAWMPNFAFQHMLRLDRRTRPWRLDGVRTLIDCSEPCRSSSLEAFAQRYGGEGLGRDKLGACYAMAETVFAVTQTLLGREPRIGKGDAAGFVSSGRPIEGAEVEVRKLGSQLAAQGELGEIWVRSASLFEGYHRQPELSQEKLRDGWLQTGDLGVIDGGELFVVGRKDDLVLVNGRNILAHELEDIVSELPQIAPGRVLVGGRFDEAIGSSSLVVLAEGAEPDVDPTAAAAAIRSRLESAANVQPSRVSILPRGFLIKSTSGKLARAASWQKFEALNDTR
jgi:acyl-CoA synthetase (AMP-forming)/AMP-acid ligase II